MRTPKLRLHAAAVEGTAPAKPSKPSEVDHIALIQEAIGGLHPGVAVEPAASALLQHMVARLTACCIGEDGAVLCEDAGRVADRRLFVFLYAANPDKVVIAQTAPAVRVSIGEEVGMAPGDVTTGKMVSALKRLGFDFVYGGCCCLSLAQAAVS